MIFVRHPPAAVVPGICYGRLDLACGPEAREHAEALMAKLAPVPAIRSSPARRCLDLARRIAARDHVPVVTDPRLHELDFGAWEGRPWAAIERAESDAWAADPMTVAPPGGETFGAMLTRVAEALADTPTGAVIVAHAGTIRAARMILTGASFADAFATPVPFCQPVRLDGGLTQEQLASGPAAR